MELVGLVCGKKKIEISNPTKKQLLTCKGKIVKYKHDIHGEKVKIENSKIHFV